MQHTERREGGGIARAAAGHVDAYHVRGLDPDVVRVLRRSAHVLGYYVAPAQGFDVAPERAEERLRFVGVRVADNHGLPAPKIKAARGGLVGHPSCQT